VLGLEQIRREVPLDLLNRRWIARAGPTSHDTCRRERGDGSERQSPLIRPP
jgi:hypothetical protein